MKGFIKLTNLKDKTTIYINVDCIGHIYAEKEKLAYGHVETVAHTVIGTTTHNNGGFKVIETPNEIFIMLEEFNLITI
jgi:hypothetical protein